jgi:hypothetical protein
LTSNADHNMLVNIYILFCYRKHTTERGRCGKPSNRAYPQEIQHSCYGSQVHHSRASSFHLHYGGIPEIWWLNLTQGGT